MIDKQAANIAAIELENTPRRVAEHMIELCRRIEELEYRIEQLESLNPIVGHAT